MKKTPIPALIILVLALIAAIGSQSFLGPCVHEDGSFGACHWAGRMLLGVGGQLAVLALLALVLPRERRGLYLAMVPASLLSLMTPGTLIALCGMATMRCRMVMRPAMMILSGLALVLALAGWLIERGRKG